MSAGHCFADEAADAMAARIKAQLTAPGRDQYDAAKDPGRKPIETMQFFGVQAGMTVGGPYSVTVSFIGFETQTVEGVFLSLGIAANVNVTMLGDGEELAEVVVTGDKNPVFSSDRTGATTAIGNETIKKLN